MTKDVEICAVLFDFSGVLAEEGFREGLMAIAARNGLDPDGFVPHVPGVIHQPG